MSTPEISEGAREAALAAVQQVVYYDDDFPDIRKDQGQLVANAVLTAYHQHLSQHSEEAAELAGFEYMHTDHSFGAPVDIYRRLTPEKES